MKKVLLFNEELNRVILLGFIMATLICLTGGADGFS
jgi:hypothetical protein